MPLRRSPVFFHSADGSGIEAQKILKLTNREIENKYRLAIIIYCYAIFICGQVQLGHTFSGGCMVLRQNDFGGFFLPDIRAIRPNGIFELIFRTASATVPAGIFTV
jgi:hypothetical protein